MATFLKLPRSFFIFWAVFLECGFLFAQSIQLSSPAGQICYNQSFELTYTLSGQFPENESFILVRQYTGQVADSLLIDNTSSIPLALTSTASVFLLSKQSGIQSNTIQINPDAYPGLFLRFDSSPVCQGYSTPIEIYTGLLSGDQINWQKDGENIGGASQNIYQANTTGIYTASVLRGQCTYKVLGQATIEVGKIEKAQLVSVNQPEVCEGFHVSLSAKTPGIPDLKMQWLYEGDTIAGATTKSFSASETGNYKLQLKQGSCTSESDPFMVNIGRLAAGSISTAPIMSEHGEVTICENMTLQLRSTSYTGRNDIEYYWLKDGEGIPGERNRTVNIHEPGLYRLGLKQGECESLSEPLLVKTGAIQGIKLAQNEAINICESKSYTIIPTAQNNDIVRNTHSLALYKDGVLLRNLSQFYDLSTIAESGNYFLSGTFGQEGCSMVSDTLEVNFLAGEVPFELYPGVDNIESCASEVILGNEASVPGIDGVSTTFQWFFNNQSLNEATEKNLVASRAGNYQLKVSIDSSCVYRSEPVRLSFGELKGSIQNLSRGLCAQQLNTIQLVFDESQKNGEGNSLGSSASIQWFDGSQALGTKQTQNISKSGVYRVKATVNSCEPFEDTLRIQLTEINPRLNPIEDTIGICLNGGYATLTSIEIGNSYQWVNNNLTAVSDSFSVQADRLGSYKVWIEKNGCYTFSESKYIVEEVELPTATLSGGGNIAIGESTQIKIDFTGPGPWTFTNPQGNTTTSDRNPYFFEVQPLESTVYSITTVENPCGFGEVFGSAEVTVIVLGTEEEEEILKVYPNPASEVLRLSSPESFSRIEYSLINIQGRIIKKASYQSQGIEIKTLQPGTYLLNIEADGKTFKRKVVIQ